MEHIAGIPLKTVYETIIANFIKADVIIAQESEKIKRLLAAMTGQELIETLIDSHILSENVGHLKEFHITERLN